MRVPAAAWWTFERREAASEWLLVLAFVWPCRGLCHDTARRARRASRSLFHEPCRASQSRSTTQPHAAKTTFAQHSSQPPATSRQPPVLVPRRIVHVPMSLPHQVEVIRADARFKVIACGRRWGKTTLGLASVLRGHGPRFGAYRGAIYGGNVWWVAPTYGVAAKIWRDLKRAANRGWLEKSEVEKRITFWGGGSVATKSADRPDTLRGDGLDGLVIDEAAFTAGETWRDVLRPALADKRGWAIFISTPNGRNWFHDLFQSADQHADWMRWRRPSSDNPAIAAQELEAVRREIGPRAFAQEHEAEFTDREGAEFSGAYFGDEIWFRVWPSEAETRFRVMAIDPSMGAGEKGDYSAIVSVALHHQGTMYVDADLERRDTRRIVADCLRLAGNFRPHAVGVEANQFQQLLADNIAEQSRQAGMMLPIHSLINRENKRVRIRARLTPYLARGELRFFRDSPGARLLVEQLAAFPLAHHDDGPDALEMAVRLLRHLFGGE
jgi:predicted phage terminase large subunit-like protein